MENSEIFIALNFCKSTVDLLPCGVMCVCLVAQSCPTLWNTMDWNPPGSSVQGILQARILEWVAIPSSRGSFQSRDRTQVSHIVGRLFTVWATKEAQKVIRYYKMFFWFSSHFFALFNLHINPLERWHAVI